MIKLSMMAAVSLLISLSVQADEVWNSQLGQIVYARDVGPVAVWTYKQGKAAGEIYVPGLAGIYSKRGNVYEGYWAQTEGGVACQSQRPGPDGKKTHFWGRFHLHLSSSEFPSAWTAQWGHCEQTPQQLLKAEPVTG